MKKIWDSVYVRYDLFIAMDIVGKIINDRIINGRILYGRKVFSIESAKQNNESSIRMLFLKMHSAQHGIPCMTFCVH